MCCPLEARLRSHLQVAGTVSFVDAVARGAVLLLGLFWAFPHSCFPSVGQSVSWVLVLFDRQSSVVGFVRRRFLVSDCSPTVAVCRSSTSRIRW